MAIIGTIRKQSGLAVIIIGVAIAAFVIGDFGKKSARGTTDIAVVGSEQIPYTDFSAKVDQALEMQKENKGINTHVLSKKNGSGIRDITANIKQKTYNPLIKKALFKKIVVRRKAKKVIVFILTSKTCKNP